MVDRCHTGLTGIAKGVRGERLKRNNGTFGRHAAAGVELSLEPLSSRIIHIVGMFDGCRFFISKGFQDTRATEQLW